MSESSWLYVAYTDKSFVIFFLSICHRVCDSEVRKQKALKLHKTEMVEAGGGDSHDDWVKGMTVNKEALDLISEHGK